MKTIKTLILLASTLGFVAACGEDEPPTLSIDVFGWTGTEFVSGLPTYDGAQTVLVSVTQPSTGRTLKQSSAAIADGKASLPEVDFGEGLRLEMDIIDGFGNPVASGATAEFDFDAGLPSRNLRLQVQAVNEFAPVGSVVLDRETMGRKFAQTQFDYSGLEPNSWLGRTGQAAAPVSDGRVLVVGGGDAVAGTATGSTPDFRDVYADIQVFSPETGYFTNIDFDTSTGVFRGTDKLAEPVAYPTLTALGDDRFLVVGGMTPDGPDLKTVSTIQLIDLNASPGSRVTSLNGPDGTAIALHIPRGRHTATLRTSDNHLVIVGGLGPGGEGDHLDLYELIDIGSSQRYDGPFQMQAGRSQHGATLMGDGSTVWITGGLGSNGALSSTETVSLGSDGTSSSANEASMNTARFAHGATKISSGAGDLVLVVGGFTDTEGEASDRFEVSKLGRGTFATGSDWALSGKRGGVDLVELPNTKDVLVFGGRDETGATQTSVERLQFLDLASEPPYEAATIGTANDARFQPSVTFMSSGQVLLVGGEGIIDGSGAGLDTAELFNPLDPRSIVVSQ